MVVIYKKVKFYKKVQCDLWGSLSYIYTSNSLNRIKLLKDCSIKFPKGKNKLIAESTNFPAEILYLRDDDIPQYVENGIADVGILGQNVVEEVQKSVRVDKYLGFSKCRLSLAVPKEVDYHGNGKINYTEFLVATVEA